MNNRDIDDRISQVLSVIDTTQWDFEWPIPFTEGYIVKHYSTNRSVSHEMIDWIKKNGCEYSFEDILKNNRCEGWEFGYFLKPKDVCVAFLRYLNMWDDDWK